MIESKQQASGGGALLSRRNGPSFSARVHKLEPSMSASPAQRQKRSKTLSEGGFENGNNTRSPPSPPREETPTR